MRQTNPSSTPMAGLPRVTTRATITRRVLTAVGTTTALFTLCGSALSQPAAAQPALAQPAATSHEPTAAASPAPVAPDTARAAATTSSDAAAANGTPPTSAVESAPSPGAAPTATTAVVTPAPAAKPTVPEPPEAPLNALFDVALVVQSVWNSAPAYDYFSADNGLLMGGITVGFDAARVTTDTVFSVDLTVVTGETENTGPLPNYISSSSLRRTDLGAGLHIRHHIWQWLAPHVRVSGAVAFEDATVHSVDFDTLEVNEANFVGGIGGGLSFYSPGKRLSKTRTFFNSLGLRVSAEGGYQFVGSVPFEVKASTPDEGIARAAIPLGELEQNGPYLRVTAGGHF